jgi:tRNA1(Val) A37 N6-methylase TrmN6
MPLFQQSVIRKHIESFDAKHIEERWNVFKGFFHSAEKQQNIRNSKEEQYQEGFLRDLFVNVLGYTINPEPNFNLLTEQKNITNSKKADGAIIVPQSNGSGSIVAVIELKGTETTDLNKIEAQAFGYKSNQPGCNYVVTSNFEKLRFYIDNTTQQEEFNLFTLTKTQFEILYACLSWESIRKNTPMQLLNESVSKENTITKNLYKDYSDFKRALFANMVELNPQFDKLVLFKKTQKLLDRFLFIFFAEDRGLLPTNLIFRINQEWKNLQAMRIPVSLYERYKIYFNDLNHGAKVSLPAFGKKTGEAITQEFEIFAYNGGLFVSDEILDNIQIDDALLHLHSEKMSHYDFESDVDVNILGHIFENSLNEIDEIKSEIEGNILEKTKTRRKKDGVFYTPKYITKYIVDNTVGKLCTEKKAELKLNDEDFISDKKLQTKTKKALLDKLNEYRAWLLDLTICDPACGSGAFLNQALEFLIAEHRYVDELQAKLLGDSMILSDIENSILERNIYGVDLNDESVEIAKLSLWLRTAQKGRKLNSLNNNIKCGNSLIDDPAVAGDKAFSWSNEFPEVFAKGGFDVVIGNPPYGMDFSERNKVFYLDNFNLLEGRFDLYELFIEKSFKIFNDKGILSFIIPNTLLSNLYSKKLRKHILIDLNMLEITNFGMDVFDDPTVHTCIITLNKESKKDEIKIRKQVDSISQLESNFDYTIGHNIYLKTENSTFDIFFNPSESLLIRKIEKNDLLSQICHIRQCIKTGDDNIYVSNSISKLTDPWKIALRGKSIGRYTKVEDTLYLKYGEWLARNWKNKTFYETPKIIIRETGNRITSTIDLDNHYLLSSLYSIYPKKNFSIPYLKSLLAILNSNISTFYINKIAFELTKGAFTKVRTNQLGRLPIPKIDLKSEEFLSSKVETILNQYKIFQAISQKFSTYFSSQYNLDKLPGKLEKWYELEFIDFIKELNKAIKAVKGTPLTKKDEFEWMDLFEENKKKALELKAEIDKTDKEIDAMVYELYGLSEEEIKIVEGS